MNDVEWDNFWNTLELRKQESTASSSEEVETIANEGDLAEPIRQQGLKRVNQWLKFAQLPSPEARNRANRFNRCGSCMACRAQDCGQCKNCLDKPRFGGPGIKKKACIARVCRSLSSDKDDTWIDEGERSEPERIEAESEENLVYERNNSPRSALMGLQRQPLLPRNSTHSLSIFHALDNLSRAGIPLMAT